MQRRIRIKDKISSCNCFKNSICRMHGMPIVKMRTSTGRISMLTCISIALLLVLILLQLSTVVDSFAPAVSGVMNHNLKKNNEFISNNHHPLRATQQNGEENRTTLRQLRITFVTGNAMKVGSNH